MAPPPCSTTVCCGPSTTCLACLNGGLNYCRYATDITAPIYFGNDGTTPYSIGYILYGDIGSCAADLSANADDVDNNNANDVAHC
ncbi:unnamed protein product [Adineta steineri]|uniref:Uncharacterized protein n=1 Tax=Adineta steineri TaxID=433720 RepID=A0A819N108_9BILA|nr:unnamed protein product [Adineta steineri]CAF3989422.1 unnamed protein product [Adineta steineri]